MLFGFAVAVRGTGQRSPRADVTSTGVVTQVVYISKTITLRGGYTTTNWTTSDPEANPTTLDAQGQGRVFYITGDISPTIEGLRIVAGCRERILGFFRSNWLKNAKDQASRRTYSG
jgi:hypothetical protein